MPCGNTEKKVKNFGVFILGETDYVA